MRLVALGSRLVNRLLPRLLSRSDYGLVWNWVGRSLTAARWSVAGTADLAEIERTGLSSADTIARETGIGPTDVVLEIGCGIGGWAGTWHRVAAAGSAPTCRRGCSATPGARWPESPTCPSSR